MNDTKVDKAKPKTAADHALSIQTLEEEIASLTVKISQTERDIEQKEIESLSLLKQWTEEGKKDLPEEERKSRIERIKDICEKERKLDQDWENLRKDKDAKIRDLRQKYLDYIKATHQEKDAAAKNKEAGKAPPKGNKPAEKTPAVTLHNSSLVTGTSQAGIDDVDYQRIFKKWEFAYDQLTIEEVKKGDKKDKGEEVLDARGPAFLVQQGTLLNKEVCIKTFIMNDEATKEKNRILMQDYRRMKENLLGHPNLLAPIGWVPATDKNKTAIIVELARNKTRSLQDVLNSLTHKTEDKRIKLGFQRKLYIAKSVASALSWLHENSSRAVNAAAIFHARLKPSNILFTRDWKVKVSDYGLGLPHAYFSNGLEDTLFKEKYAHYMAPELFAQEPQPTAATDAWALGMIFYTLLTDRIPYAEAKDFNDLRKLITDKKLPELPDNTPGDFKDIIVKCWDPEPKSRILPKTIAESDPWAKIFQQASLHGKDEAKKIWDLAVKSDSSIETIPWDVLGPIFWETFLGNSKPKISEENCIKHLVRVAPNGEVPFKKFSEFASTFSPFRTGKTEGPAFIKDLIDLCSQKWFYGLKQRGETEALLNSEQARKLRKEKKFPFLVRLSDNKGYQFCISFISVNKAGKDEVYNQLVPPEHYVDVGFLKYLKDEIKKKKLEPLAHPERPFDFLLDEKAKTLKMKQSINASGGDSSFLGWSTSLGATGTGKYIT